jgi:hypothetical protein
VRGCTTGCSPARLFDPIVRSRFLLREPNGPACLDRVD